MIVPYGPVGTSRMTAAAATKRMCTRNIDFTSGTANVGLGYVSTDITVTAVHLFVEVNNANGTLKMNVGTDATANAIVATDAIPAAGAGNVVDISPVSPVDIDAGHALLAAVAATDVGGGQAAIEYHERE